MTAKERSPLDCALLFGAPDSGAGTRSLLRHAVLLGARANRNRRSGLFLFTRLLGGNLLGGLGCCLERHALGRGLRGLLLAGYGRGFHGKNGEAGSFVWILTIALFGGTPEDEKLADLLYAGGTELFCDFSVDGFKLFTVVRRNANLDEFVVVESAVDFVKDGIGETVCAEKNDRIKVVGLGTKGQARIARENDFFHNKRMYPCGASTGSARCGVLINKVGWEKMPVATKKLRSNRAWIERHINDPFVKRSKAEGYRARSVYKLTELDDREHLLRRGMTVVELGAAPGSWTQIVRERLSDKDGRVQGRIIAMDILPMDPIDGVTFLQGDFREQEIADKLAEILDGDKVDVVLSDMAPNLSGIAAADAARSLLLNELAHEFCLEHLKPNGVFVTKSFQGSGFSQFVEALKKTFKKVYTRKPAASRDTSAEVYLVARELKPGK